MCLEALPSQGYPLETKSCLESAFESRMFSWVYGVDRQMVFKQLALLLDGV